MIIHSLTIDIVCILSSTYLHMYHHDYTGSRDFSDVSAIQALQILTHFRENLFCYCCERKECSILTYVLYSPILDKYLHRKYIHEYCNINILIVIIIVIIIHHILIK